MATKLILKKSVTSGSAPVAGDIDVGELAINLADRKIYAKDNSGAIVLLDGAYVDSSAPANPAEGDLWYDTTNNVLKAHDGSTFKSAGYATLSALEDVTITSAATGEFLRYNGTAWVDSTIQTSDVSQAMITQHEAAITIAASQVSNFDTEVANNSTVTANTAKLTGIESNATADQTAAQIKSAYESNSNTQAFTDSDHTKLNGIEASADVTDTANVNSAGALMDSELTNLSAVKAINQGLTTTSNVAFNNLVLAGNLTVNGTTTSVNSNEVNIGDSIIVLNSDETGTPSENGGFEIERGTSANVSFVWNETDDAWDLSGETLQNVTLDGGTY